MGQLTHNSIIDLDLSKEEVGLYANVLNEILNGLNIQDLEQRIGTSREAAESLLERLNQAYQTSDDTKMQSLSLRLDEARILKHGFLICIQELGNEEMSARTGFSVPEAKHHVLALDDLLHHSPTWGIG